MDGGIHQSVLSKHINTKRPRTGPPNMTLSLMTSLCYQTLKASTTKPGLVVLERVSAVPKLPYVPALGF